MRLRWQESGGPPVTPPGRKGFGSRLIEGGLAQDLGGEVRLDYEPSAWCARSPCLSDWRWVDEP
jgi:two-component sensor histidine kinase